jgi:hypothetical protein
LRLLRAMSGGEFLWAQPTVMVGIEGVEAWRGRSAAHLPALCGTLLHAPRTGGVELLPADETIAVGIDRRKRLRASRRLGQHEHRAPGQSDGHDATQKQGMDTGFHDAAPFKSICFSGTAQNHPMELAVKLGSQKTLATAAYK